MRRKPASSLGSRGCSTPRSPRPGRARRRLPRDGDRRRRARRRNRDARSRASRGSRKRSRGSRSPILVLVVVCPARGSRALAALDHLVATRRRARPRGSARPRHPPRMSCRSSCSSSSSRRPTGPRSSPRSAATARCTRGSVAALRTAISLGRRHKHYAIDDEVLAAIADDADDAALAFINSAYRAEFSARSPMRSRNCAARARPAPPPGPRSADDRGGRRVLPRAPATAARHLADARARLVSPARRRASRSRSSSAPASSPSSCGSSRPACTPALPKSCAADPARLPRRERSRRSLRPLRRGPLASRSPLALSPAAPGTVSPRPAAPPLPRKADEGVTSRRAPRLSHRPHSGARTAMHRRPTTRGPSQPVRGRRHDGRAAEPRGQSAADQLLRLVCVERILSYGERATRDTWVVQHFRSTSSRSITSTAAMMLVASSRRESCLGEGAPHIQRAAAQNPGGRDARPLKAARGRSVGGRAGPTRSSMMRWYADRVDAAEVAAPVAAWPLPRPRAAGVPRACSTQREGRAFIAVSDALYARAQAPVRRATRPVFRPTRDRDLTAPIAAILTQLAGISTARVKDRARRRDRGAVADETLDALRTLRRAYHDSMQERLHARSGVRRRSRASCSGAFVSRGDGARARGRERSCSPTSDPRAAMEIATQAERRDRRTRRPHQRA